MARHPRVPHWCSLVLRVSARASLSRGVGPPLAMGTSRLPASLSCNLLKHSAQGLNPDMAAFPLLVWWSGSAGLSEPQRGNGTKAPCFCFDSCFFRVSILFRSAGELNTRGRQDSDLPPPGSTLFPLLLPPTLKGLLPLFMPLGTSPSSNHPLPYPVSTSAVGAYPLLLGAPNHMAES